MIVLDRELRLIYQSAGVEKVLDIQPTAPGLLREDISEYVAQLQLHMALQARNLLPNLNNSSVTNSRQQMLQETQAIAEKLASRQSLSDLA
jgi:23S rRNA pseudoU1915 N3-methylase RlmH